MCAKLKFLVIKLPHCKGLMTISQNEENITHHKLIMILIYEFVLFIAQYKVCLK